MSIKIGDKFGYLEVIDFKEQGKTRKSYLVKCVCGNYAIKGACRLLGSKNRRPDKSCGCKQKAVNGNSIKHKRIYSIWQCMVRRCHDKTRENYSRYGGAGVVVCEQWRKDFISFLEWSLVNGYADKLTIDRIDNTKGYEPSNCKWSNYFEQAQNKGAQKRNKLGVLGVSPQGKGYRAHIQRNNKRKHLGYFAKLEDAIEARRKAEINYQT